MAMELTRVKWNSKSSARPGMAALAVGVALAGGWQMEARAATAGQASATQAPARHGRRHPGGSSLDGRVAMLSKALGLDAKQQSELRKVLMAQREEVSKVWADNAAPAAVRVKATEVISERTADRIRALLNAEQRKKYNPPKPAREGASGAPRPNVDTWMNPAKAR